MAQDFQRIQRLPPYVFEQVNKLKAQARAQGNIIDFGGQSGFADAGSYC